MKFLITQRAAYLALILLAFVSVLYPQAPLALAQDADKLNSKTKSQPEQNFARSTDSDDETAILPYYNNYLKEYHLGPEDVISVQVFGQPNYSKSGIVVPPTARIAYPLVPGGIFVGGRTTEDVGAEITKKLNEYIIDPQVTVTLEKVGSARFGVLGAVASPGIRVMNRRYNLYEAIVEAGGIVKGGDKKRVMLVRLNPQGGFSKTVIDLGKLVNGQASIPYLLPGDQIIVPEKTWSLTKVFDILSKAGAVTVLFGIPF